MKINTVDSKYNRWGKYFHYHFYSEQEVLWHYANSIRQNFSEVGNLKILEIGAGFGKNLIWFNYLGIPFENIYANEIDENRLHDLRKNLPSAHIFEGDFSNIEINQKFDIILQSTVFTSVFNAQAQEQMAKKMLEMLSPNGIIIWYDFKYNSPYNKQLKGINRTRIKALFSESKNIKFYNVTLVPPLARKLSSGYNLFNTLFPFLRTHLIAQIKK